MYQVERKTANGNYWYEVMLSPFKTLKEAEEYLNKYSQYYSAKDRVYRITTHDS